MNKRANIEVFFDGGCPVCLLEIRFYKRMDWAQNIAWTDIVKLKDNDLPKGKKREQLLNRFHVRELYASKSDDWYLGVDAFARIWRELPFFRSCAWIFSVPGIRQIAKLAYLGFIRWQSAHRIKRTNLTNSKISKSEYQ